MMSIGPSILKVILVLALGCARTEPVPATPPADDGPAPSTQPAPATDPVDVEPAPSEPAPSAPATPDPLDELLDRLERSAADLRGFKTDIRYVKVSDLLGRKEIRQGELIYELDGEAKRFAILFDRLQVGRRLEQRLKHYVFDGRWLVEIDHDKKQFIKREVVEPGAELDPLKLGEGPFPLPVGQAKDEVLARFEVSLIDVPDDGPLAGLENVDGVLLVPRPHAREADEFERVELFYDRATSLPVGIRAVEVNGDEKIVLLENAIRNPDLSPEDAAKLSFETPDPSEWKIDVRPWSGP